MPIPSQFALSLELTRLVPIGLATSKAAEALMSLARDLQNSGSDIVIEEDLASVFGRCRIYPSLASSFKTIVSKTSTISLDSEITLINGPGPTVGRALQETPYFATVVQISLLTSTHEKKSLAQAIHQAMEKSNEGAPLEYRTRAPPTFGGILGVLTAIEEQTSSYDWSGHLLAVSAMLPKATIIGAMEALPPVILRGALSMFPLVQSLPSDRLVFVEGSQGLCTLVTWAHHVLGLTVLLKLNEDGDDIKFGGHLVGDEQVVIDTRCRQMNTPCISLLDATGEKLFRMQPDPDETSLDSCFKRPAKGYGKVLMWEKCASLDGCDESGRNSVLHDMTLVATAFAFIISQHLVKKDQKETSWHIPSQSLLAAARFLFDDPLTEKALLGYISAYSSRSLDEKLAPPASIESYIRSGNQQELRLAHTWKTLTDTARVLSVVLIALAHVRDLMACESLPLTVSYTYELLRDHDLLKSLETWSGTKDLFIYEDTWLSAIVPLLTGQGGTDAYDTIYNAPGTLAKLSSSQTSLLSNRGWSVYNTSFGIADPSFIDVGFISVAKGVPCRNGVWKHQIIDGPSNPFSTSSNSDWTLVDRPGDTASLHCANEVYVQSPLCGDREDAFVITIRLLNQLGTYTQTRRTGYWEMDQCLWLITKSQGCKHSVQDNEQITLSPGCSTVKGFEDMARRDDKVTICLTARNTAARWRAVVAVGSLAGVQVFLRGRDCCFACAIDQAAKHPGKSFLIL